MKIKETVDMMTGSPQFRIIEVHDLDAPLYQYYGQSEIEGDLVNMDLGNKEAKYVRTFDEVVLVAEGDIVFSLISGMASLVRKAHQGYLLTQNYVKFELNNMIESKYFVYLINENISIRKQLKMGLQGSMVLKYTLKQIKDLELPQVPSVQKQKILGELYFNQMRLGALRERSSRLEMLSVLERMKGYS